MDKTEVARKVKEVVADVFDVNKDELSGDMDFIEDLHARSMNILELLAALEMEFGFRIPQRDVKNNQTINQAIDYMYEKVNAKK